MATTATRSSLLLGLLLSLVLVQNIALVFSYDQFSYLPPSGHNSWALPNEFASFGDRLFFSARDQFRGAEPWVTDGTVNGTHIFADLNPGSFGSSPVGFTSLNGKLFFITLYQRTPTIWISDGTPAGTTAIPGTEGARERLVVNGDYLVFTRATTETGTELWSLNSLTLEVRPLGDFVPGVGSSSPTLKATNGTHSVWFLYDANFNFKPFITDGTPEGTFLVPDVPGSEDRWFLSNVWASGTDFVITRNSYDDRSEFYRTNGVSGTLVLSLESITIYSYEGSGVFLSPTQLLFVGRNTEGYGVYSTNFTPEGTIRIHYPGTDLSTAILNAVVGGRGLFTSGTTMYSTDGTVAGTTMVGVDISAPVLLGFIEGDAIFVSAGFSNTKLYRTDGIEVHLLWTGISYLYSGNGALGSRIFFGCSETDADGIELCSTDGTPAGTGIWEHIDTVDDGFPYRIVPVTPDGTTVAFLYNSSVWTANGLPDGTHKILDESPSGIVAGTGDLTGSVFFNGGSGFWRYDSSTGELTRIFDLPAVPLASANSRVFMYRVLSRYEAMLYSSDGTVNNTIELGYVPTSPQGFVEGDVFIFTSLYTTGGVRLMKSDGLTVSVLKDINPSGDASPRSWVPAPSVGGHVFIANSPAVGLWKTDGTTNGTVLLHDLSSFFPNPVMQNGYIYLQEVADLGIFILIPISSTGSDVEYALYLYDPETDSISSEAIHSWPRVQTIQTASTGDRLILIFRFTTATSTSTELWSSDGTTAGTIHITPPAQGHIFPSLTSAPNGRAYFVAWSPVEGEELWSTGGTQATTSLVPGPAYPGILGSVPRELTIIGNRLYFNAISTSFVRQIYVIPFGSVEPSSLPRISSSPGHVPSHSPSSHPSTAPSAAPSIPPPRVLLHIFGPSGWLSGEQTFEWGTGRCRVKNRMVPSAIPLTGTETPVHLTRGRALKVKTKDWAGCGGFYYHHNHDQFLDLRGAKEIRFWIRSNTLAKIEFEIGEHDSTPREPESDQNPLKDFIYVDTTGDKWVQVSLSVAQRPQRVYSPFLITIFGRGYAMVSNVIAVAY